MNVAIKVAGTAAVCVLLTYPLWAPGWGTGLLGEIWTLGMPGAPIAVAAFLGAVALYCRALQTTLTRVRVRTTHPASVWWMFAIPYNFVEDFFIVRNVAGALAADGRLPAAFVTRWAVLGYGWCAFQILSLFPGAAGLVGGAVAIPLWLAHWVMTARFNAGRVRHAASPV
jgi:hypothetical protein